MSSKKLFFGILVLMCLVMDLTLAETVYIDDKILVGVHQGKSTDTAILKLLPGGTILEVIKQDTPLTQVRDPDGTTGWIDNKYLVKTAPGRAQLQAAESKIAQLEEEISKFNTNTDSGTQETSVDLKKENEELRQLLKSERLRVGELQAQSAELKNKLAKGNTNNEVDQQLEKLTGENTELRNQIIAIQNTNDKSLNKFHFDTGLINWKKQSIIILVSLILGFAAGIYILDLKIRRRHGGFRI